MYFVGTSVLVSRHINKHNQFQSNRWIEAGSRAVLDKLLLDSKHRESFSPELQNLHSKEDFKRWASEENITNVVELEEESATSWVGSREGVPFRRTHLKFLDDVGFYKNANYLNFNYFLKVDSRQFLITQQIDDVDLSVYLDAYGMEVAIVESDGENSVHLLYTTLPKTVTDDLAQKISFDEQRLLPESMTLAKEIYMVKTVDLIPHGPLQQKIVFTKKMSSYELLKIQDVLIFIWTFFCISIALNVVLFKYADPYP